MTATNVKNSVILHAPVAKAGGAMPRLLAVGPAEIAMTPAGKNTFAARWSKGASQGEASLELRAASRLTTELTVSLQRPTGAQAFLWPKATLRRLEELLGQALAYEIETRALDGASPFGSRRTSPELVRARAS